MLSRKDKAERTGPEPGTILRMEAMLADDIAYQSARLREEQASNPGSRAAADIAERLARVEKSYASAHQRAEELRGEGHTLPPSRELEGPMSLRGRALALLALMFSILSW